MCVPVIESCECQSSCYLAPLKEQHLENFTDENGQAQQRWKVTTFSYSLNILAIYG